MKVVKRISDGIIIYSQIPNFEPGNGITNAILLYGGNKNDYEEVEV